MAYYGSLMFVFATLMSLCSARAVNISNTWVLPEEGFPVFYRYFRDRISWYEADAVCQFHHANLVTADSSSQYDAIRAYLKELDITENVWIGLSKTSDKPSFTWTNFQPLSGEGHWREAIPKASDALCATMDPAADFQWKALPCGGPEVASFICELPIPSWALGPRGCLLTELPSLTVLYIPEQSAVELTSDCGLDGTKRIACKGSADREEILRQLTCAISRDDFDDKSTKSPIASSTVYEAASDENSTGGKTTKNWIWTSNTVDIDYGMPTRHRRETEDTLSPVSTRSTAGLSTAGGSYRKQVTASELLTTPATNYGTEFTTHDLQDDSTLDANVPGISDRSAGSDGTGHGLTTQKPHPEERADAASASASPATADPAITITDIDEAGAAEFPSAINQGQLFSIIENGTMFDIIELNDTNVDLDSKSQKNAFTSTQQNKPIDVITISSVETMKNSHPNGVKLKPEILENVISKKDIYQEFEHKKSTAKVALKDSIKSSEKQTEEAITKEIEMYPIIRDSSIKLNRTFRKEVPPFLDEKDRSTIGNKYGKSKVINLSINNDISDPANEHLEIKLEETGKHNFTETLFIESSKKKIEKLKKNAKTNTPLTSKIVKHLTEQTTSSNQLVNKIISNANNNSQANEINRESEAITKMKENFLPKSLLSEDEVTVSTSKYIENSVSQDPLGSEPEDQPRPNRQRQLTRPQRRSFYPYFFSRVLG